MSGQAFPISSTRFVEALKNLPIQTLHMKANEIRNNIAHLIYSNKQLAPYAEGLGDSPNGHPDQDCKDAIRENEIVIARMHERIQLLKSEVQGRGSKWLGAQSMLELKKVIEEKTLDLEEQALMLENPSNAWEDGTFVTSRVNDGSIQFGQRNNQVNNTALIGTILSSNVQSEDVANKADQEGLGSRIINASEDEGIHL